VAPALTSCRKSDRESSPGADREPDLQPRALRRRRLSPRTLWRIVTEQRKPKSGYADHRDDRGRDPQSARHGRARSPAERDDGFDVVLAAHAA